MTDISTAAGLAGYRAATIAPNTHTLPEGVRVATTKKAVSEDYGVEYSAHLDIKPTAGITATTRTDRGFIARRVLIVFDGRGHCESVSLFSEDSNGSSVHLYARDDDLTAYQPLIDLAEAAIVRHFGWDDGPETAEAVL